MTPRLPTAPDGPPPAPEASGDVRPAPAGPLRFFLRAVVFVLPVLAWQGLSTASYVGGVHYPYQALQRHQEAKLVPTDSVETVLLGDSSLGNGIDAAQFSAETGSPTVSLALTGLYGYLGSANMLARASGVYPNLKNVVVVNTPDMLARRPSARGQLLTLGSVARVGELDGAGVRRVAGEALALAFSKEVAWHLLDRVRKGPLKNPDRLLDGDYMRQADRRATPTVKPLAPEDIDAGKAQALADLVADAEALGLTVLYAHGPLWADQLEASGDYLTTAERTISAAGATFVPGLEPIPTERLGDSADHVAPEDKRAVTSRYAERLRPYLE